MRNWTPSDKDCSLEEINGFLKPVCFNAIDKQYYHVCVNSRKSYELSVTWEYETGHYVNKLSSVSSICDNDLRVYQACGFSKKISEFSEYLCGGYFIADTEQEVHYFEECDRDCGSDTNKTQRYNVRGKTVCNNKCDEEYCEDESDCNGLRYGLYCNVTETKVTTELTLYDGSYCKGEFVRQLMSTATFCRVTNIENVTTYTYRPVSSVCDESSDCDNKIDEEYCSDIVQTTQTCIHYLSKLQDRVIRTVPIFNYTRCAVFDLSSEDTYPYCYDYLDQTNCTDVNRVGGHCLIGNNTSTVSKYVLCDNPLMSKEERKIKFCDDNLESECISPPDSTDCTVHKHKLCDGVVDCKDFSDEDSDICRFTTPGKFRCNRTFNMDKEMEIPVSWIWDNHTDCADGKDQDRHMWKFCDEEEKYRVMFANESCKNAFLCPSGRTENHYVEFDLLCDGINSCDSEVENNVCTISRDFPKLKKSAKIEGCSTRHLCDDDDDDDDDDDFEDEKCHIKEFEGPLGEVFGVSIKVNVSDSKRMCNRLFGEYYVFLSCMGMCLDSTCPLPNTPLNYDSCPVQFPDRVYTLAKNSSLTFVTRSDYGEYENDYFQCDNRRCVKYSQVCDLVNDCGDMSDEINCTNHLVCNETRDLPDPKKHLISRSQKCDGIFDCFDLSDECNDECKKQILDNLFLKCSCWLLGILAIIFNAITVVKVASCIKECNTGGILYTRVLICLIGIGDLIIGVYLIGISVFDGIIHGTDYCQMQAQWLSGKACAVLGVISTIGSQFSLFAMTLLSIIRLSGIVGSAKLAAPKRINKRVVVRTIAMVIGITLASLAVALIPLIPAFEDYFVQGMYYHNKEYKVFIGFPNKVKHIKILKEYYGNDSISNNHVSWAEIGQLVNEMFTQNYGSLVRSAVHFYGNDGVCLFKYFVRSDDPRRGRGLLDEEIIDNEGNIMVWLMLGINFFCFVLMTVSYLSINIKNLKSASSSGQSENPVRARETRQMQIRVALIIGTDFACWVPFIIICALHNIKAIDATEWYDTFAMIVLPINSVINPLLYDNTIKEFVDRRVRGLIAVMTKSGNVRDLACENYNATATTATLGASCMELCDTPDKGAQTKKGRGDNVMNEKDFSNEVELKIVSLEDLNIIRETD